MATWAWIVIVAMAVVVVCLAALVVSQRRRTRHLKQQFGPEYDRATKNADGKREAEAELLAREKRREEYDVKPLSESSRVRYASRWQDVQAGFVDEPEQAVEHADDLVNEVMSERGYPMDDFDQRAADVSVDHPEVVENYRKAHRIYLSMKKGTASTEEERQAMRHYRSLFDLLAGAQEARSTERTSARG
jgi:hypothetical protein